MRNPWRTNDTWIWVQPCSQHRGGEGDCERPYCAVVAMGELSVRGEGRDGRPGNKRSTIQDLDAGEGWVASKMKLWCVQHGK
jgi:hypothetical protein